MEILKLEKAVELIKKDKDRKFNQSVDLIINLKGMDVKREDQRVDQFLSLPYECGKQVKVCAFVDKQLLKNAQDNCDFVISNEDFQSYAKNKKELKKLANGYDYFISQINVMAEIAKIFGRVLGSRGKMPNPKAGCVVQGTVDLNPTGSFANLKNLTIPSLISGLIRLTLLVAAIVFFFILVREDQKK